MSSVSPVLRTCRWIALPVGYWYGTQRNEELKLIRAAERAQEMDAAKQFIAAKHLAAKLAAEEYAKNSYLYGTFHEE